MSEPVYFAVSILDPDASLIDVPQPVPFDSRLPGSPLISFTSAYGQPVGALRLGQVASGWSS